MNHNHYASITVINHDHNESSRHPDESRAFYCAGLHLAILEIVHSAGRVTQRDIFEFGKLSSIELTRVVVEVKAHLRQWGPSAHSDEI